MNAFVVYGHDNDLYFFRERPDVRRCPVCGALAQKWNETLADDIASHVALDVSASYDGVLVVSDRFRTVYDHAGLRGLRFTRVGKAHWAITAERTVRFDAARRKTRFEDQCPSCGRFGSVSGATPAFLAEGEVVAPTEFVRTDLEFATGDEQHPLLICGGEAAHALRQARLSGLELRQVQT